jgi:hypothetical protein
MPLSTSNSNPGSDSGSGSGFGSADQKFDDSIYREIPNRPWLKMIFSALGLTFLALIGWEYLARANGHETGKFLSGFTSMWAEERRKLDQPGHSVKIVLLGSSRILWGADLDILEEHLGTRPLQLSLPGTGPSLFVQDIVDNTDFKGLILVGVTPFLFNRIDKGAYGKGAWDSYHNQSPSQWSGSKLQDLLSYNLAFVDEAFGIFDLLNRHAQLPPREGAIKLEWSDWKLGNMYHHRQMDMWAPVEQEGSFDNIQVTNFWRNFIQGDPPPPPVIEQMTAKSIEFFSPLVKKFHQRGGEFIFIRMPSSGLYWEFDQKSNYKQHGWNRLVGSLDVPSIYTPDYPELSSELDIPEWSHLSRASQDIWSHNIISHLNRSLMESRQIPLEHFLQSTEHDKDSEQKGE